MFALTKEDSGLYTKIDCEEEKKTDLSVHSEGSFRMGILEFASNI